MLSYKQQSEASYARPRDRRGLVFVVGFPLDNGKTIEVTFRLIEGMLIGDGSRLMRECEKRAMFTRSARMSKLYRRRETKTGKVKKTKWTSTHS